MTQAELNASLEWTNHLSPAGTAIGILLFMGALAAIPAICAALWFAIKVWFTAKIARKGWGD